MKRILIPVAVLACLLAGRGSAAPLFDFERGSAGWEIADASQSLATSSGYACDGRQSLAVRLTGQSEATVRVSGEFHWADTDTLSFHLYLPEEAATQATVVCYLKDKNWNWFETAPLTLRRGEERAVDLDVSDESTQWRPVSHLAGWDGYTRQTIREIGIKFFFPSGYDGTVYLDAVAAGTGREPRPLCLYNFRVNRTELTRYERYEARFEISAAFLNPFDPETVSVDGVFTSPSGKTVTVPAVFSHDYTRFLDENGEQLFPSGKSEWLLRFAPLETGRYTCGILVRRGGRAERFPAGGFSVTEGTRPGFVRWDKQDPQWLAFDNGSFFYPIGHTLRSADDERSPYPYEFPVAQGRGTFAYDETFPRMHQYGENYIRLWMSAWWLGLEWSPAYAQHYEGLGRYSLENAWRLDHVLDAAEASDIHLVLTLINHGQYSVRPDAEWWDNPYNVTNGGFLTSPEEFFTSAEAERYIKRRLRYIIGRWGYSPSIVFWELWNEVDLTGYYDTQRVRDWHARVIPYLKSIDPWNHPVTTHYCRRDVDPLVWIIPQLESLVGNAYSQEVVTSIEDYYRKRRPFDKPLMVNEFGVGANHVLVENNLHAGIWSSSMLPMFGTALFWWWPVIDHFNLYTHYQALARFWAGEDRRGKNLEISNASVTAAARTALDVVGMQNDTRLYLWIFDTRVFNSRTPRERGSSCSGTRLTVRSMQPGEYRIEFWDTARGGIIAARPQTFSRPREEIAVPDFTNDIALKITRAGAP